MHPDLTESLHAQETAPEDDWQSTFRRMVMYDLAKDMELGNFLSYYRNFAIPHLAATLVHTREVLDRPMKRSYDTAIVIYELIANGLDSPRGQEMVALLNRVHRYVPGSQDDFRYVMLTLLVVPIRWTQQHGWRQPTDSEVKAATRFFRELGERMHISGLPETFQEAEALLDAYEAAHIAPSRAGQELMDATVRILRETLPRPVRPLTRIILSAMFDDDRLTDALGLPRRRKLAAVALNAALAARNFRKRRRPLPSAPRFSPGHSGSAQYPSGYSLSDLGPENVMGPDDRSRV
jgi:ER-bound oxygenase mpaB/B'/Rubber oxygenase, catalytic domain